MSVMTQRLEFLLTDYIPWLSDLYIPLHTVSLDLAFIVLSLVFGGSPTLEPGWPTLTSEKADVHIDSTRLL